MNPVYQYININYKYNGNNYTNLNYNPLTPKLPN